MFERFPRLMTSNERALKPFHKIVPRINAMEPEIQALSDDELRGRILQLRGQLSDGATLDALLPETFAVVREAARRVLGMRPFDVQLLGGMVLNAGKIAEMKTGEGKTLVATLPVVLNAVQGLGVHVVTVNDYLAQRDSAEMGKLYAFLGLSTGVIVHGLSDDQRRAAYACDITYGTNNEFGFDYLRDNMKFRQDDMVQRPFAFGIVDEVDSILIDEARTPLIISGPAEDSSDLYRRVDAVMANMVLDTTIFDRDEKQKSVALTELGSERVEDRLRESGIITDGNLYDMHNMHVLHHVQQSLRAHALFRRDIDYIVQGDEIVIVDEFTGRKMVGRRFSDGLHQALEAKEAVTVQPENQTLASITFQNYFRLYPKLAGMTGTALTEADEFNEIYKLDVVEVPTNVPVMRQDAHDEVYRTAAEKHAAIAEEIEAAHNRGQPVLVGTTSVQQSELLSSLLDGRGVPHNVLNAKFHEREAGIVAQAGAPGAITIATNMAGRGTDIKLGGNAEMRVAQEIDAQANEAVRAETEAAIRAEVAQNRTRVVNSGGLLVIGSERHESRRIDNQLRGRAGRQGDPGASRFYLSLEDDLMRIFGSERIGGVLQKLGLKSGEAIISPMINRALERAQKKVEARNFDMRKNVLKYDDVLNSQRREIYAQRLKFMRSDDVSEVLAKMRAEVAEALVAQHLPDRAFPEQWDSAELAEALRAVLAIDVPVEEWAREDGIDVGLVQERVVKAATRHMEMKASSMGPDRMRQIEKSLLLQNLDAAWKEHLLVLDQLRQGIWMRSLGQKDPLNEYKREAFGLFHTLLEELRETVTTMLAHVELPRPEPLDLAPYAVVQDPAVAGMAAFGGITSSPLARNAPCPCGSGRKFKHCHGRPA